MSAEVAVYVQSSPISSCGLGKHHHSPFQSYGVWVSEKSSSMAEPEWLMKLTRR
jgi:hypothetical protein